MDIYKILGSSVALHIKSINLEGLRTINYLEQTLALLLNGDFILNAGSQAEGTDITASDYHSGSSQSSGSFSDIDVMNVLYHVRVIAEDEALQQTFDNHMYLQAERGKHTADGFRKLSMVHQPERHTTATHLKAIQWEQIISGVIEDGYISSAKFVSFLVTTETNIPWKHFVHNGLGMHGPSNILEKGGSSTDFVRCFYVKTWPKEAEPWLTRDTYWPDKQLKNKIKKMGYLLVPTGNNKSQESNLEWRCSFSMAEKILFKSMTKFQRCTFVMSKILIKEYLPSDINTDGEKQLLSTYHMKTLFLWCLEDSKLHSESGNMLHIIHQLLNVLLIWIKKENFPHYFIPSVNLLDGRHLHVMKNSIKRVISAIKNDLPNKIRQSKFFKSPQISRPVFFQRTSEAQLVLTCHCLMKSLAVRLQRSLHDKAYSKIRWYKEKFSHTLLMELLVSENCDRDLQLEHLYRALNTEPLFDKLLTIVVPGLIDRYRGCMYLALYCIAERNDRLLLGVPYKAESLLRHTLHLDPCSGHVKLACLYIATGDFARAMDKLFVAENHFLYAHKRMKVSARIASGREGVDMDRISTDFCHQVFQQWAEGLLASNIVVTWLEYYIVPALLQFELIHESTQQVIDGPGLQGEIVGLNCHLGWPPLSMIKLLKFICVFNTGRYAIRLLENLVADLIVSGLSAYMVEIYTVFNMAAWCYLKTKNYKQTARMMTVAIVSRMDDFIFGENDVMKQCAFCHHFLSYVIAQCLL